MDKLKLNPDEAIILRNEEVGYGNTILGKHNELILTNQAILLVKKGMFGKTKDVLRFPLNGIRIVNGQVQALMGKKDLVTPSLDLYFESGSERFFFTWENDIQEWIDHITSVVTGKPLVPRDENAEFFEDIAKLAGIADTVSDSIFKVKDALGIKSNEEVVKQCSSCGASLTGIRGEVSECPYCGSYIKF